MMSTKIKGCPCTTCAAKDVKQNTSSLNIDGRDVKPEDEELDNILDDLQVGTLYAENTEPGMSHHRNEAKTKILTWHTKALQAAKAAEIS